MSAEAAARSGIDWARVDSWTTQIVKDELGPITVVFSDHGAAPPTVTWNPDANLLGPAPLRALAALWWSLPLDGRLPHLSRIRPFDMRKALGHVMVLDVIEGGRDFRYRLFGSTIARILGFDMTGRLLSDHPAGAYVLEFALAVYRAAAWRGHAIYSACAPVAVDAPASWQSVALPFIDDDGVVARLVSGAVALGRDGLMITA